jgi:hypothetical protein
MNHQVQTLGEEFYYTKRTHTYPKVYDIAHRFLPKIHPDYEVISHIFTFACLTPFLFYFNLDVIKVFIGYALIIFLIRDLTTYVTILPRTKTCDTTQNSLIVGGCFDKIVSGHTSAVFLATLIFYKYRIIRNIPILISMNAINAFLILLTRHHYTIDVIMAFVVTLFVFTNKFFKLT